MYSIHLSLLWLQILNCTLRFYVFFLCPNLDARHDNVLFAIALQVYDQSSCYCYTCFMSFVLLYDSVWSGPSTGSFCQSLALIQHIYCWNLDPRCCFSSHSNLKSQVMIKTWLVPQVTLQLSQDIGLQRALCIHFIKMYHAGGKSFLV